MRNVLAPWSPHTLRVFVARLTVVCGLLIIIAPASALAVEEKPFGIKNFTIQTIERTEEPTVVGGGEVGLEFINKPYTFTQAGGHPWALMTAGEFTNEQAGEYGIGEKTLLPGVFPVSPTHDPRGRGGDLATRACR